MHSLRPTTACHGELSSVSSPFQDTDGPQPPKLLKAHAEIVANLRLLQDSNQPLVLSFNGRNQRFQSFIVEVDSDNGRLVLDELVPNDGERFLKNGEQYAVQAFHDGVRIAWECNRATQITDKGSSRCYIAPLPLEISYYQRRSAYRAPLKQSDVVEIELAGNKLRKALNGGLQDISATGCKLKIKGDVSESLQSGQVYEKFTAKLPFGAITTAVELRHISYDEKLDTTIVGARFYRMEGLIQRNIERFVYQLQREARRFESESFL